jgi:hypothetical protein
MARFLHYVKLLPERAIAKIENIFSTGYIALEGKGK